jgi:hypothetical protein
LRILGLLKHREFVMKDDDREHGYLLDFGKPEETILIGGVEGEQKHNHSPTSYAGPGSGRERKKCSLVVTPQKAAGTELEWIKPIFLCEQS